MIILFYISGGVAAYAECKKKDYRDNSSHFFSPNIYDA